MQLRKYQKKAIKDTIEEIFFGSKNVVIQLPTGAGKSLVISALCKKLEGRIVILVNITSLIDQIAKHLDILNEDYSILKAGREKDFDENHRIQIVMSQTYYSRKDVLSLEADYIIQDERHKEYNTERTKAIVNKLKPKSIIGTTATPFDEADNLLENCDLIIGTTVSNLENEGFLTPVRYYLPKWSEKIDYSGVKKSGNDYSTSDLDRIINTPKHLELALESMNKLDAKNKKTIVFASSIEQCDNFTSLLNQNGYEAFSYHSKADKKESEMALEAFKTNKPYNVLDKEENDLFSSSDKIMKNVKCLVSVSKLSIGFDVPDIQLGVQLRPTKVRSLFYQQVGRLCRLSDNKEYAEYLDLGQTVRRFGLHNEDFVPMQYNSNKEKEKKDKYDKLEDVIDEFEKDIVLFSTLMYDIKLKEIESRKLLALQDNSSMSLTDMLKAYNIADSIKEVIILGSKIHTMIYGEPISKKGNFYKYNVDWLYEDIEPILEKYPSQVYKWTKAYKTRGKNIIKEGGNWNSIKFFIEFLVEKYEEENSSIYEQFAKNPEPRVPHLEQMQSEGKDFFGVPTDYDDDIPF